MTSRELLESISVVIAVDGKLAEEERQYLFGVAKQLGVSKGDVSLIFDKVREGRGVVATPKSIEDQVDLYAHLLKAASSDGEITTKERRILNDIGERFGVGDPTPRRRDVVVTHAEHVARDDPKKSRVEAAVPTHKNRVENSNWPHLFWAASVTLIAIVGMGAVLFYKYVPSPKDGSEALADGGRSLYDDFKQGGKELRESLKEALQTKESIINSAVVKVFSDKPKLVVSTGEITVNSKDTKDRFLWGTDTTLVLKVSGIKVQYFIPLENQAGAEIRPDTGQLVLHIPRPVLDLDMIEIPDSRDPDAWDVNQVGFIGSDEMLDKLRAGVKELAIKSASSADRAEYKLALERGKVELRRIIEPVLHKLVPEAMLDIEYEMAEVSAKKTEN